MKQEITSKTNLENLFNTVVKQNNTKVDPENMDVTILAFSKELEKVLEVVFNQWYDYRVNNTKQLKGVPRKRFI